ncbi:hypothetical protein HKX48_000708 [Thoreauomyces humboldtii]|nr:hypothetical protein HKX48_000708 [Thoreauomyces humboldtii]
MSLTAEQIQKYQQDGYLVLRDFFTAGDAETLRARAKELLETLDVDKHPKTKFKTGEKDDNSRDEYFLDSGDKVRFFFEEGALNADNTLKVEKTKAINKIGHALHELEPAFKEFSTRQRVKDVIKSIGYKEPRILQSMLIFKQPEIGGVVPPHQDSTFLYTEPLSAMGLWFALEDCTPTNGCMYFVPGSHKTVPVYKRFVRKPSGDGTTFINLTDEQVVEPAEDQYVCEPTPVGCVVLIHGSVLHKSSHNASDKSRWIYTFHTIEGKAKYPADNWLQPTEAMPFTRLY